MCSSNLFKCGILISSLTTIIVAVLASVYYGKLMSYHATNITVKELWWGTNSTNDTSVKPFTINVSTETIDDLYQRLKTSRPLTKPLEGINEEYGFNTDILQDILQYWINKYDWKTRENYLNKLPQYKTSIQGLDIHFIHVKPKVPEKIKILPLLLLHGWPGSVREFYDLIPILTTKHTDHNFVFEVVAPSLPGFGFSDYTSKQGLNDIHMAVIMKNLMLRLGFKKFYVQGGDWGSIVANNIGILYPKNILGLHSNMCFSNTYKTQLKWLMGALYPPFVVEDKYEHYMYPLSDRIKSLLEESGYFHLQATKPDTIGVALNESPIGLAAYMLEKFSTLTDFTFKNRKDRALIKKFGYEKLLDNIMVYWVTHSMTTAMRIYSGNYKSAPPPYNINRLAISEDVYCACARFKHEIIYQPVEFLKDKYTNLVHYSVYDFGGHFIALEEPQVLGEDVFTAIGTIEKLRSTKNI